MTSYWKHFLAHVVCAHKRKHTSGNAQAEIKERRAGEALWVDARSSRVTKSRLTLNSVIYFPGVTEGRDTA